MKFKLLLIFLCTLVCCHCIFLREMLDSIRCRPRVFVTCHHSHDLPIYYDKVHDECLERPNDMCLFGVEYLWQKGFDTIEECEDICLRWRRRKKYGDRHTSTTLHKVDTSTATEKSAAFPTAPSTLSTSDIPLSADTSFTVTILTTRSSQSLPSTNQRTTTSEEISSSTIPEVYSTPPSSDSTDSTSLSTVSVSFPISTQESFSFPYSVNDTSSSSINDSLPSPSTSVNTFQSSKSSHSTFGVTSTFFTSTKLTDDSNTISATESETEKSRVFTTTGTNSTTQESVLFSTPAINLEDEDVITSLSTSESPAVISFPDKNEILNFVDLNL